MRQKRNNSSSFSQREDTRNNYKVATFQSPPAQNSDLLRTGGTIPFCADEGPLLDVILRSMFTINSCCIVFHFVGSTVVQHLISNRVMALKIDALGVLVTAVATPPICTSSTPCVTPGIIISYRTTAATAVAVVVKSGYVRGHRSTLSCRLVGTQGSVSKSQDTTAHGWGWGGGGVTLYGPHEKYCIP